MTAMRDLEDETIRIKLLLLGNTSVGKTSLLLRFTDEGRYEQHKLTATTVGIDFRSSRLRVDNREVALELWDTAGMEKHRGAITYSTYRGTHGLLLVYDITKMDSFEALPGWIAESQKHLPADAVTMIIGNKVDEESEREVTTEVGKAFAHKHGALFLETSAWTAVGVTAAFEELVRGILANPFLRAYAMAANTVPVLPANNAANNGWRCAC